MHVTVTVSFKEYLKLLYAITYRKPIMIIILCVDFIMWLWIVSFYTHLLPLPEPVYYQYATIVLITIVQPLVIYYTIRRNYYSSNHLREKLKIEFTEKEIKIQGESFYMELMWTKTYKTIELKHWYLIYQNNLSAVIIPKKSFKSRQEKLFKELLLSIKGLHKRLLNEDIT